MGDTKPLLKDSIPLPLTKLQDAVVIGKPDTTICLQFSSQGPYLGPRSNVRDWRIEVQGMPSTKEVALPVVHAFASILKPRPDAGWYRAA